MGTGNNKTYSDTDFTAGDSPATLEILEDMGRPGTAGFLVNDGSADIQVEIEDAAGNGYGEAFNLAGGEALDFEPKTDLIKRIKLTHIADSAYRCVVK